MGDKIKQIYTKYRAPILYIFFGGCTTLINIAVFRIASLLIPGLTLVTNAIAWVFSVAFAFVTNKLFVFESRTSDASGILREIGSFTVSRLATFALDELIMYVSVDILLQNELLWKIISNVVVIVLNYVLSKFIVFAKKRS